MKILINNSARQALLNIYYYNYQYSSYNAIEINKSILFKIQLLKNSPYIGRYIPEIHNNFFREILYKNSKHSTYQIMYYISETDNTIYIINIINSRQDFKHILKTHNFFKVYYNFNWKFYLLIKISNIFNINIAF